MTTLADIRRIFSVRGLDPDRITQPPAPGEASFLFTTRLGGQVWFAPHEQDRQRIGWAYSAWNRHGELTEAGCTDTTAPEGLLPVLGRHQSSATAPASPRQYDTLLALAPAGGHSPWAMSTQVPADRWILGLFVAWTQLREADAGGVCGGDLVDHLDEAFAAIGLTDVELDDDGHAPLDELAAHVDPGPAPDGEDPAVPMIAAYLAQALDQALEPARDRILDHQLGVLTVDDLAAEMAADLRRSGLLSPAAGAVNT
ncbi:MULTISPECIES: hypothetical protein [Pseudonocardia]|uniref:Uncharacterized protein n=2 Tax=Pseudonocardia TaxID=1847 RepID=A0A1Y2MGX4_PSEAH|nr:MULTISPECIES: hypothetical protein [Pseudonocardia]OSY34510.1 hypothetical protein BG845_06785 [Pseudonocardia autotrophica]TDN65677.1 hypothetical protein C8E95_7190 [Pseudonocardia autotrophica]BBG05828.1 hypothetical protein Pdca_70370 [Pseudonocardia autotrophica]GEC29645.1 hypothetical protein PSA01_66740 [Pseudonocardia saturnea]